VPLDLVAAATAPRARASARAHIGSRGGKALKAFKAFPASENLLHQDAGAHVNQLVRQLRGLVHGGVVIGGAHVNDANDLMRSVPVTRHSFSHCFSHFGVIAVKKAKREVLAVTKVTIACAGSLAVTMVTIKQLGRDG